MALLIPEHMTAQGKKPYPTYICDIDPCDPLGTQGRQDHLGGAHPEIEPERPIMALLIPEHMTVQGEKTYPKYISYIDQCDPLKTQGRKDHLGGSHPEIEPKWPIMALLIPEHMTVQEKNPFPTYISDIDHCDHLGTHGRKDHLAGEHTPKSSRNGRLWHSSSLNT